MRPPYFQLGAGAQAHQALEGAGLQDALVNILHRTKSTRRHIKQMVQAARVLQQVGRQAGEGAETAPGAGQLLPKTCRAAGCRQWC